MKTLSTLREGQKPETVTLLVATRLYSDGYIALCNGKRASSTASREEAARKAGHKAALALQYMGIIKDVPTQADLKLINRGLGIYHIHLGPCAKEVK